ncbi:MAG: polyprenyl synthetase family protein [Planctomycetota bacterium]
MSLPSSASAPRELGAFLAHARSRVEEHLERWLPKGGEAPQRLADAMRYSVGAGGKRLRPALALAGALAVGGREEDALPFAAAVEMLHTYSLIHDDLPAMDDDDLRRGRPTSHKVFGEALAILAGDALHTEAFRCLLDAPLSADVLVAQARRLADAAGSKGMVGGQVDDLAADGMAPSLERLQRIHRAKTGALIAASVVGGALAGGADTAAVEALERYGAAVGLAFQIADDVLDETATAEQLGKTPGKDRADAKMTYVALAGLDGARRLAADAVAEALAALSAVGDDERLAALARYAVERPA